MDNQSPGPTRRLILMGSAAERPLVLASLAAALAEVERLGNAVPFDAAGNWTWSKTLLHCAQSIAYSMTGYPQPKSAWFQHTAGAAALDANAAAAHAVATLHKAVGNFQQFTGPLQPHFAYGALNRVEYGSDRSFPSIGCIVPRATATHNGSTTLVGFDAWRANDNTNLQVEALRGFFPRCRTIRNDNLGNATQRATGNGGNWRYSGVPGFFDLSQAARDYGPGNPNASRRDSPLLRFAIRLTRDKLQANISTARSPVKPSGRLDLSQGDEAKEVMAARSTAEVFFERPVARNDRRTELASTFNPFWQVRLIGNNPAALAATIALQ